MDTHEKWSFKQHILLSLSIPFVLGVIAVGVCATMEFTHLFDWQGNSIGFGDNPIVPKLKEGEVSIFAVLRLMKGLLIIWGSLLFTMITTLWLCSRIVRHFVKPLVLITEALRQMADERWDLELPAVGHNTELEELRRVTYLLRDRTLAHIQAKQEALKVSRAKSEFLECVSHEIRTPLHAIMNYTTLCLEDIPKNQSITYLHNIKDSSAQLLTMSRDLLTLTELDKDTPRFDFAEYNISACIEAAQEELKPLFKSLDVEFQFSNQLISYNVYCDRELIMQLLINLLTSAARCSPPKEVVMLELFDHIHEINGHRYRAIMIRITDKGEGIPIHSMFSIFEAFEQGDHIDQRCTTTGMSMVVAADIVRLHRGRIWIEEKPGCVINIALLRDFRALDQSMVEQKHDA